MKMRTRGIRNAGKVANSCLCLNGIQLAGRIAKITVTNKMMEIAPQK